MPSWISEWDKVLLYCLGSALIFSIIHGGAFSGDILDSIEFVTFAIGLSLILRPQGPDVWTSKHTSLIDAFGRVQDIEVTRN